MHAYIHMTSILHIHTDAYLAYTYRRPKRVPSSQTNQIRGDMEAQAIAMCLNAYARSTIPRNVSIPALFLHLGSLAQQRKSVEYRPQTIALIYNAFAKNDVCDQQLFTYLAEVLALCTYISAVFA